MGGRISEIFYFLNAIRQDHGLPEREASNQLEGSNGLVSVLWDIGVDQRRASDGRPNRRRIGIHIGHRRKGPVSQFPSGWTVPVLHLWSRLSDTYHWCADSERDDLRKGQRVGGISLVLGRGNDADVGPRDLVGGRRKSDRSRLAGYLLHRPHRSGDIRHDDTSVDVEILPRLLKTGVCHVYSHKEYAEDHGRLAASRKMCI